MTEILKEFQAALRVYQAPRLMRLLLAPRRSLESRLTMELARRLGAIAQVEARTFWGGRMTVHLPEPVSLVIHRFGLFEPGVAQFLLENLHPGMTFFDVGAHFGFFSLLAARLVGPTGQVHSFEPTPRTFSILQMNALRSSNMHAVPAAVFSKDTTLEFNDYGFELSAYNSFFAPRAQTGTGQQRRTFSVNTVSLDSYVEKTALVPSMVKIDAESAEGPVVEGMRRLIREHHPLLILEVGDLGVADAMPSRELISSLIDSGYEALEWTGTGFRPHALAERYESANLFFRPRIKR